MKTKYLLPARFKKIGWIILIPSIIIGIPTAIFDWNPSFLDVHILTLFADNWGSKNTFFEVIENNLLNELMGIFTIIGGLLVAFSREPDEDELITKMRLESLVWAVYWNYGILMVAFLSLYDMSFYWVMVFNMFTPLILFIIKFNWTISGFRTSLSHEE